MAIAYDNTTNGGEGTGGLLFFNHVVTGTNNIIILTLYSDNSSISISTPTISSGGSFSLVGSVASTSPKGVFMYHFETASAGTYQVQVSFSGGNVWGVTNSYSGAVLSGQPDSSTTVNTTTSAITTSVVASNCWLVAIASSISVTPSAGSGTTGRFTDSTNHIFVMDSNGSVGTGSQSLNLASSLPIKAVVMSIAPYVSVNYTASLSTGTFSVTGGSSVMSHIYHAALATGVFALTGFGLTASLKAWIAQLKSSTGWTNKGKGSSTWTNKNKSSI